MIDFHSHILPRMDDGPKSADESDALIALSEEQGITDIVATPHFYCNDESPEVFASRREKSFEKLKERIGDRANKIILGAEVYFFEGIDRCDELEYLKIQNTNCILVEMPFVKWTSRTVETISALKYAGNNNVILAHIERYFDFASKEQLDILKNDGILFQMNAGFFVNRSTRSKALKCVSGGLFDILGTDCHNTTERPPYLQEARKIIIDKVGMQPILYNDALGKKLLHSE